MKLVYSPEFLTTGCGFLGGFTEFSRELYMHYSKGVEMWSFEPCITAAMTGSLIGMYIAKRYENIC